MSLALRETVKNNEYIIEPI